MPKNSQHVGWKIGTVFGIRCYSSNTWQQQAHRQLNASEECPNISIQNSNKIDSFLPFWLDFKTRILFQCKVKYSWNSKFGTGCFICWVGKKYQITRSAHLVKDNHKYTTIRWTFKIPSFIFPFVVQTKWMKSNPIGKWGGKSNTYKPSQCFLWAHLGFVIFCHLINIKFDF